MTKTLYVDSERPSFWDGTAVWRGNLPQLRALRASLSGAALRNRVVQGTEEELVALLPFRSQHCQDELIRDNITPNDVLIVSVGGNDIALSPTPTTILSMLAMVHMSSLEA